MSLHWIAFILLIVGILFSFLKSGVIIDFENQRIKEYIGVLIIKKGKWQDIDEVVSLEIQKSSWSQEYNVQTISTVTTIPTSSLFINLPDKKI